MKSCECCCLADAYVNGQVVRKMKYRKESGKLSSGWFDYNNNPVSDPNEIARLEQVMSDSNNIVDCHFYRDHNEFMRGANIVNHIDNLPATKNHIIINWDPTAGGNNITSTTLGFANADVFDGDSFYIVVKNISTSNADLYAPVGDNVVNIWGNRVDLKAGESASAKVLYNQGVWYWELAAVSKGGSPTEEEVVINDADLIVIRFHWTDSNGRDLDTATELVNSSIPGVDGQAVGWSCPGNGNATVSSILNWGGDNTGSGQECVFIDMAKMRREHFNQIPGVVDMSVYGTWFGSKNDGGAEIEIEAYKGGTMTQSGYNFINTGGERRYNQKHSIPVDTMKGMPDYKTKYTHICDISFDKWLEKITVNIK